MHFLTTIISSFSFSTLLDPGFPCEKSQAWWDVVWCVLSRFERQRVTERLVGLWKRQARFHHHYQAFIVNRNPLNSQNLQIPLGNLKNSLFPTRFSKLSATQTLDSTTVLPPKRVPTDFPVKIHVELREVIGHLNSAEKRGQDVLGTVSRKKYLYGCFHK